MNHEFTVTGAKVLFEIPVLGGIAITAVSILSKKKPEQDKDSQEHEGN